MKAKSIVLYRDGGTEQVKTEDGNTYWIDRRILTKTFESIYNKYPGKEGAEIVHITLEIDRGRKIETYTS